MFGLSAIATLLSTVVSAGLTAYNKSKDVAIATVQASVGIAQAQAEAMNAWIGHPFSPPALLAYSVAVYYGKAIAYDNVVSYWITGHPGFTPPLNATTAYVAMVVISGMFFSGISRIMKG